METIEIFNGVLLECENLSVVTYSILKISRSQYMYVLTFWHGVEHEPWESSAACDGRDVDDASSSGEGGVEEEGMCELADMEARLQVGPQYARVVLRRALRRRLRQQLPGIVHL